MELLFLLSGYLYKKREYVPYLFGKVNRILTPYLIWGAVFLLMPVVFSSVVHRETSLADGFVNYLLYGGGYWFLYVLFFIFVLYPFFDAVGRWLKIAMIATLLTTDFLFDIPEVFCLRQIVYYLPFFTAGNLLAGWHREREVVPNSSKYLGVIGMAFSCVLIAKQYIPIPQFFSRFIDATCVMGIIVVCARFILILADETKDILLGIIISLTSLCGKYSLQLYLFNGFLLVILRVLLCSILHVSNPILIVGVISFVDIAISILICVYVLPKSKFLSYICGVKSSK
jgi:peptidoglycan/LPS O-acetylase OafA/YrhL